MRQPAVRKSTAASVIFHSALFFCVCVWPHSKCFKLKIVCCSFKLATKLMYSSVFFHPSDPQYPSSTSLSEKNGYMASR